MLEFNGVLGDVFRKDADVGIGQYFILPERVRVASMTNYYDLDPYCAMLKRPDVSKNWRSVFQPFNSSVWVVLVKPGFPIVLLNLFWLNCVPESNMTPLAGMFNAIAIMMSQPTTKFPR